MYCSMGLSKEDCTFVCASYGGDASRSHGCWGIVEGEINIDIYLA